jgi:hypothetical protein
MIAKRIRIGAVSDQDTLRRHDRLTMTPSERIMCLIRLRDRQFGATVSPVRGDRVVTWIDFEEITRIGGHEPGENH